MILGRLTLVLSLLITPAVWAQFGKADMMKLATDRVDTLAKALKLSPDQVNMIKPLLESKYTEMGAVKEKFMSGDKSDASKKEATDSLKSINSRYDDQITSSLNPDQAKKFKDMNKSWKNDLSLSMPKY
jgi:hypothetical protein